MNIDSSATTVTSMRASRRALRHGNGWGSRRGGEGIRRYHFTPKTEEEAAMKH